MYFALKLGFAAATAGVTWLANRRIQESSQNWEGKVCFYNYMENEETRIEDILAKDNGHIVELKVMYKDAGGSVNNPLSSYISIKHVVLIIRTSRNEYWSIEKNEKVIHVQKDNKLSCITNQLSGKSRNTNLVYSSIIEHEYFDKKQFNVKDFLVSVNDVFEYVSTKETSVKFNYLDNCQHFLRRLLTFICNDRPCRLQCYNYINRDTESTSVGNILISILDLTWLYKEDSRFDIKACVGFLIKDPDGFFWSFEYDKTHLLIQLAEKEEVLLKMENGKPRQIPLVKSYDQRRSKLCDKRYFENEYITEKHFERDEFIEIFRNDETRKEFTYRALQFIYNSSTNMVKILRLYNFVYKENVDLIKNIQNLSDICVISEVTLWGKLVNSETGTPHVGKALVLIISANDRRHWGIEREGDNYTCIQYSNDREEILEMREKTKRERPLEFIERPSDNVTNCSNTKMKGLLEFVVEFHRKFPNKDYQDIIEFTLDFLGMRTSKLDFN